MSHSPEDARAALVLSGRCDLRVSLEEIDARRRRDEFLRGVLVELQGIRQDVDRIDRMRRAAVRRLLYGT